MESVPSPQWFAYMRQLFDQAIAIPPEQRQQWLLENVPDDEVRAAVARLLLADCRRGLLDTPLPELFEAIIRLGRTRGTDDPSGGDR